MGKQEVIPMNPDIRIQTILLIIKIRKDQEFAKKITVRDSSHYRESLRKIRDS